MGLLQGKELKHEHVREIIDKIFDHYTEHSGKDYITFQELYTAILLVYNDINKRFPGPHYDPPTREEVHQMLEEIDTNRNGVLDRQEFTIFMEKFTSKLVARMSKKILIFSIVVPALAFLTKAATERIPGIGPFVKKVPSPVYASLITMTIAIVTRLTDRG